MMTEENLDRSEFGLKKQAFNTNYSLNWKKFLNKVKTNDNKNICMVLILPHNTSSVL